MPNPPEPSAIESLNEWKAARVEARRTPRGAHAMSFRKLAIAAAIAAAFTAVLAAAAGLATPGAYLREARGEISTADVQLELATHYANVFRAWGTAWGLAVLAVLCEICFRLAPPPAKS
jgi:hypothetical protein